MYFKLKFDYFYLNNFLVLVFKVLYLKILQINQAYLSIISEI
jgi:hypothetical protein